MTVPQSTSAPAEGVCLSSADTMEALATKLLDFIDNEGPEAIAWKPISETAEALRRALKVSKSQSPMDRYDEAMAAINACVGPFLPLSAGPFGPSGLCINEPSARSAGPIEVYDKDLNDIAEFYHNEHATVSQSYETALALAKHLVAGCGCVAQGSVNADLLQACKGAAEWLSGWASAEPYLSRLESAIAKAESSPTQSSWQPNDRAWDKAMAKRLAQLEGAGVEKLSIPQILGLICFVRDGEGSVVASTHCAGGSDAA